MTTWLVSRHLGAVEWFKTQHIYFDEWVVHLDVDLVSAGDIVMGILPMDLAAQVCAKGAVFYGLTMQQSLQSRGVEKNAAQMQLADCQLKRYDVREVI